MQYAYVVVCWGKTKYENKILSRSTGPRIRHDHGSCTHLATACDETSFTSSARTSACVSPSFVVLVFGHVQLSQTKI